MIEDLRAQRDAKLQAKIGAFWAGLLVVGFTLAASLNLPGQLPLDSVSALWEGRHHVRMTWGPPMYSAILGAFDAIVPGTGLFLLMSMAILLVAWWALAKLRPRVNWLALPLLVFWFASPEVLIFQGTVWRDVLCANLTVAAFAALAGAERWWANVRMRWLALLCAGVCLAFAALVRQNAGIVLIPAAAAVAWAARGEGWRRAAIWSGGVRRRDESLCLCQR